MLKSSVRSDRGPVLAVPSPRRISPAHAYAEREADSTASRVLRDQAAPCACGGGCPTCATAPTAARAGGRRLDPATRAYFEPRFGRDLGDVRVHDDPAAARSARLIGAKGYTVGADIAFARGRYAPDSTAGRALLAHELAHVVQHGAASDTVFRSEDDAPVASASEVLRLAEEMKKLAARNAWTGVARAYEQIDAMRPDGFALAADPVGLHMLGAEAARNTGDIRRYMTLLLRARAAIAGATGDEAVARRDEIDQVLAGIKSAYGTVHISPRSAPKSEKKREKLTGPVLVREVMPFPADEQRSVLEAAKILAGTGYFTGLIPAGVYLIDGQSFTVISGTDNYFEWGK